MIPFFLPVWRSAVLRDAILGILLAFAVLHVLRTDAGKPEAGADQPYSRGTPGAASDGWQRTLRFLDLSLGKKQ